MAARLTDKQKKKIVADYVLLGSYSAAAKENGVSPDTARRIVLASEEIERKLQQKKTKTLLIFWPIWKVSATQYARL